MDRKAILFLLGEGDTKNECLASVLEHLEHQPVEIDLRSLVTQGQDIGIIAKATVLTLLSDDHFAISRAEHLVQPILDQKDDRGFLQSYDSDLPHLLTRNYICGVTLGLIQAAARSEEKVATAVFKLVVEIAFSEADRLAVLSSSRPDVSWQLEAVRNLEQTYYRKAIAECTRAIDVLSLLPACRLARDKYRAGCRLYFFGEMLIHRLIFALQSDLTECAFRRNKVVEHLGWVLRHPCAAKKKTK